MQKRTCLSCRLFSRVATRRQSDIAAEGSAEGTGRTVADPFGNFGNPDFFAAEQIFREGHAPASRYSIGGSPTLRVNRSKNAERDSAASLASCATVHWRVGIAVHPPYRFREPRIAQARAAIPEARPAAASTAALR